MKLNRTIVIEKEFSPSALWTSIKENNIEELAIRYKTYLENHHSQKGDVWRDLRHWSERGHSVTIKHEPSHQVFALLLQRMFKIYGIESKLSGDKEEIVTRKKITMCKDCGEWFEGEGDYCEICYDKHQKNNDPYEVTLNNLVSMVTEFHSIEDTLENMLEKSQMLREITFGANRAYMNGYISEEVYSLLCKKLGVEPDYEKEIALDEEDYYDYSNGSKQGFYYDNLNNDEE